jgi:hypothetical protein
MPAQVSGEYK